LAVIYSKVPCNELHSSEFTVHPQCFLLMLIQFSCW